MVDVLYSLVDVTQRFDQLILDPFYIHSLDMTSMTMKSYFDRIYSIDNQLLDRICQNILPRIHHQVNELIVEQHSMENVIHTINYPQLYSLSLIDFQEEILLNYLIDNTTLRKLLTEQITCLKIDVKDNTTPPPIPENLSIIFALILSLCKGVIELNFCPFYYRLSICTFELSSTNSHVLIYVIPLIVYIAPCLLGWTDAGGFIRDTCVIFYANTYIQIFNTIFAFALPIFLNILVMYASIHHVRAKAALQKSQHYVSAREKLNRSLVIQFICFYTVWGGLWSPNIIVYQASINKKDLIYIVGLLNYINVAIDPIIVAALDFRLWHAWRKHIIRVKRTVLFQEITRGRVKPSTGNVNTISARIPRQKTTTM
ncbi:unnamed protein product [Rotaria sordida]|uniref:G-protein coupled receptors family 1 profile domain-containing protein n=2 Tax=Rotaria sordida TaxID=392033 RepID=A0A813XMD3_9BILA|nr:unnamed protein product [Rotaria sordida]